MTNNNINSERNNDKKTIKIIEERNKSKIKEIPPNFNNLRSIKYHNNNNGKLISKE